MEQSISAEAELILSSSPVILSFSGVELTEETAALMLTDLREVGLDVTLVRIADHEEGAVGEASPPPSGRYYFVGGDVRWPGQKPYLSEMTVTKAIEAAGGLCESVRGVEAEIVRSDREPLVLDLSEVRSGQAPDIEVRPGDKLFVRAR